MPVETDKNVVAAFFFWFCAARSRAPRVYFQRKDHKPHFLRPFPSLLTSMGSMCFRRSERQQKCPSAPSNATVGADGDVAIVSFFLSVFSQAYLCPRRSANQDGAEEERSCPCPRGGHDERKFAAEGSGTGGLSTYYSSFRRRGGSYLRGRKYLSALFFRIPFRRLLPLFVVLTLRSNKRDDSIFLLLPCLAVASPCVHFRKRILIGGACGVLHRGGRQRGTISKPNTEPNTKT